MPVIEKYAQGAPCWVHLGTDNAEASKKFYGDLFGWAFEDTDMNPDEPPYTNIYKDGLDTGGMYVIGGPDKEMGVTSNWGIALSVNDINATVAKATEMGADIYIEPFPTMDLGYMAVISDPTGAAVGLWQPVKFAGLRIKNEHASLSSFSLLMTTDPDAAIRFYSKLLGFTTEEKPHPMLGKYYVVSIDGETVGAIMQVPEHGSEMPSHWEAYFQVDDIDAMAEKAKAGGANVVMGPADMGELGHIAYLTDPQGAFFGLVQP